MRRSDREITTRSEIIEVMERCDVCRIALNGDGYPYILPLNFGMETDGEQITLYFHGAATGTKYDLIARDDRVSFEMDCGHALVSDFAARTCTMEYQSVIGTGRLELLPEEEKLHALTVLVRHYHKEGFPVDPAVMPHTVVMRLTVEQVTGKARRK